MTRFFQKLLLALSVALMLALDAHASLTTLNQLFVFGDSLSDGGNYSGPGAFPPYPFADTRYSNGPTAVEYLWQAYHSGDTTFKPSNFGGTNYALGGATSGSLNYNANALNPSVPDALKTFFADQGGVASQVSKFTTDFRGSIVPDESLFVIWAFPNDVFSNALLGAAGLSPKELITTGVTNIVGAVQQLSGKGATNFLIPNMPDLGKTPAFSGDPSLSANVSGLTVAFNTALAGALTALDQGMNEVSITQFDTFGALNAIIADKELFGFTNVTQQCVANLQNGRCNDPNTWLFWDGVHPTTAGHTILGAQFAAAIPEPDSLWLVALALMLLTVRGQLHRRRWAQRGINTR
ncbi:SGNH/GDSL hydrolase family protein [Rhodoferax antarcticus]|uniref:GDSL-like Lipase/Acylhydrolase family protein n=1 Tax=Rhodoferax antarcticus ANT.BR TaxID=1111071 RepID=A0A1Q8YD31_9BURK|nr:SGNH/GDSL hydrolase family protein [Rhodoferax antarcticus]APW45827.1 hypothetical protein RA876_04985 [Rhodoferax antarcticus]MCW2310671.1 phospholipase/lecithinase/hemolysin [Rhodoferax antarcticus]OLP05912.1 GDSL-like Lipase/Acylhydrolase family protein [Rhodoferax antarcticus ANT.BR]